MKYRLNVSKGFLAVSWNDEVIVEAEDKDEAREKALKMAEEGLIEFDSDCYDDSDSNFQVEDCELIFTKELAKGELK